MLSASTQKKKIKKAVENQLMDEVKKSKKSKAGWKLIKGLSAGKVVIRTDEYLIVSTKKEAIEHIQGEGRTTQVTQQQLDDSAEGGYMTVELWKVQPKNDDAYFWFVERILKQQQ